MFVVKHLFYPFIESPGAVLIRLHLILWGLLLYYPHAIHVDSSLAVSYSKIARCEGSWETQKTTGDEPDLGFLLLQSHTDCNPAQFEEYTNTVAFQVTANFSA